MTDSTRNRLRAGSDAGMTLPEVLISMTLTGLLVASLAMAITVISRQGDNTSGRLNNARSEQNVGIWMPSDLASAEVVSTDAGASPCGALCPPGINNGGSNAVMLTWRGSTVIDIAGTPTSVPTETKVSYRYVQNGDEYMMIRVECTTINGGPPSCKQNTVLHDLDPPPPNVLSQPGGYQPGITKPTWVMEVSEALDPADWDGSLLVNTDDPTYKNKNAQRVVVTINGGGDADGLGGGTNKISLSAGGTERHADSLNPNDAGIPPTFIAARSRCGGNYGMLIDTSGSINRSDKDSNGNWIDNMATVRTAITSFIDTFAGTPVKLQLVDFDATGRVLGGDAATGARYFNMLNDTDIHDLKLWVNGGGTTSTGATPTQLTSDGGTNWEDGLTRMFRRNDGTIQTSLPKTLIFFTDGEPTFTRLGYQPSSGAFKPGTTMLPAAAAHPDDSALTEIADGQDYAQVAFNRANRVAREFGAQVNYIGVFVGAATNTYNDFVNTNVGYHLTEWQRGHHVLYERGYHDDYQRGNNVIWERGYHDDYQRGNNVIWERGYHSDYQRGNNVSYQYATTGVVYEKGSGSSWSSESVSNYLSKNTTPDSSDGHRARVTGALGGWTSMSSSQYAGSNGIAGPGDAFRTTTTGIATSWTSISEADYTLSNTTTDSTDGFRIDAATKAYSAPFAAWESTTAGTYGSNNSTADAADGWRTRQTAASTSWTAVSSTEYNASNTTADASDGWQQARLYTSPFSLWESATESAYNSGNTTSASTDGWRTRQTSSSSSWTSVSQAIYNASNTTADSSDGWRIVKSYTSPFGSWEVSDKASYDAGGGGSGWRSSVVYSAPYDTWEPTDEATFLANNTGTNPSDGSDGWRATKVYTPPYTGYDATQTISMSNKDILGKLVNPAGIVTPEDVNPADGIVDNPLTANMYATQDWSKLQSALTGIALGECGGTLTLQTKLASGSIANDPFQYQNSLDLKVVETNATKKSGTFDFPLAGGGSVTVKISPQPLSNNSKYSPDGWTCKAGGVALVPTTVDEPSPAWDSIQLTISANQAVSCVQKVIYTP